MTHVSDPSIRLSLWPHAWRPGTSPGPVPCFISHVGEVRGCGYLALTVGNVRERPFSRVYRTSPVFAALRDPDRLGGKRCAFELKQVCGGCRVRAYAATGDYPAEEPYCSYVPGRATARGE